MTWSWTTPPGAPRRKNVLRRVLTSFLVGVMCAGAAWAGASLVPTGVTSPPTGSDRPARGLPATTDGATDTLAAADLGSGQILAGAAKISMEPRPEAYGGQWDKSFDKCATLSANPSAIQEGATHVVDTRVRWHENPNCIYMGGYGIGPMNPITNWDDPYGLWVRSVAISDGKDTVVLSLLDGAYYEGEFNSQCNGAPFSDEQDCGFLDLRKRLAESLGIQESGIFLAFTHSHTAPEFIGAWGGVPNWYMQQIEDSIEASVTAAVRDMRPATLEIGEDFARQFSSERRDYYRSAEDQNIAWFRLVAAGSPPPPPPTESPTAPPTESPTTGPSESPSPSPTDEDKDKNCEAPGQEKKPDCQPPEPAPPAPGPVIATVGAFAAHPVTEDTESGTADADFPAVFAKAVEQKWGGTGILFQTGLGNISPRGGDYPEGNLEKEKIGFGLASLLPDVGQGRVVANPDVKSAQHEWAHPVTNSVLGAGGLAGVFDRSFNETPAAVNVGKSGFPYRKCTSSSPISVETVVNAATIGPLWITGGPGELFSNLTNTIKEKNPTGVTLPLAITNDGLGYIMQSFETDHVARQGVGFGGSEVGASEYEDAYSIDHCMGDATLEYTLQLLGSL